MPREKRHIYFTYDEAYKAIYSLCVQKEIKKPPPGNITEIKIDAQDEKKMLITITNRQDDSARIMEYSTDFLAAALMVFCRQCSIPLPKRARKAVILKGDDIVLNVEI